MKREVRREASPFQAASSRHGGGMVAVWLGLQGVLGGGSLLAGMSNCAGVRGPVRRFPSAPWPPGIDPPPAARPATGRPPERVGSDAPGGVSFLEAIGGDTVNLGEHDVATGQPDAHQRPRATASLGEGQPPGRGRPGASGGASPRCRPGRHATTTRDGTLGTLCRHSTRTVGQLGDDSARSRQEPGLATAESVFRIARARLRFRLGLECPSSAPRSEPGRLTAASRRHLLQRRALPTARRTPVRRSRSKPGLDCPRPEKWRSAMHPGQDAAGASHPSFKTPDPRREFGGPGAPALRVDPGP